MDEEDATSDDDMFGNLKAKVGDGWRGAGLPWMVGRGALRKELQDRGGICSPGRWPPARRRLPPLGAELAKAFEEMLDT